MFLSVNIMKNFKSGIYVSMVYCEFYSRMGKETLYSHCRIYSRNITEHFQNYPELVVILKITQRPNESEAAQQI